jgi:putative FmdB family regulatory protein
VPTYQYTCTECGEQVEVVQKFTDDALTVCTACGGRLRKVFSPVGIVFKGSGFYRNDSRKSPASDAPAKKDKEPAGSTSSDSSSGTSKDSGSSGSSDKSSSSSDSSSSSSSSGSGSSSSGSGSSGSGSSSGSDGKKGSKSSAPATSA